MKNLKLFVALAWLVLLFWSPARAQVLVLNATHMPEFPLLWDFSVEFDDDGDGLLHFDEIISVTGGDPLHPELVGFTDIQNWAVSSGTQGFLFPAWHWSADGGATTQSYNASYGFLWLYEVSAVETGVVPEPSAWLLFITGFAGLALLWRRRWATTGRWTC